MYSEAAGVYSGPSSSGMVQERPKGTLYLIGLGLGDSRDITLRGLEIIRQVSKVYLENYTSILSSGHQELEALYGREITLIDRDVVERKCETILEAAESGGAAVLIVGDPLNATTHTDLLLRAVSQKIPYKIIHNASIINAVACCGLQIYNFGETVSIPFWTPGWKPESFFDKIIRNLKYGLHTLCLLDIKINEPDLDLMARGIQKIEPARFMSVGEAARQVMAILERRRVAKERGKHFREISESTVCLGLARIGSDTQVIQKGTLIEATEMNLGGPLHSLVIAGHMHPMEEEMIQLFRKQP